MTDQDTGATIALLTLDSAVSTAYTALRDIGLGTDPARDALLGHVADTIKVIADQIDGVPAGDDDTGGTRAQ